MTDPTRLQVFKAFAVVPFTLLAAALLLQHFAGHKPCPLCILQREGFLLVGLIALAAAVFFLFKCSSDSGTRAGESV